MFMVGFLNGSVSRVFCESMYIGLYVPGPKYRCTRNLSYQINRRHYFDELIEM